MPRQRGTKIWNQDLIRAMRCRQNDAVATMNQRQTAWLKGVELLTGTSGEIYQFNTGRVVGLPHALSQTVRQECEAIIRGDREIIPSGMEASDPEAPGFRPAVAAEHPYLARMGYRKGGYALLLAFHHHPAAGRGFHYKDELIANAQPYCDDAMAPNFFAGRARRGALTSAMHHHHAH